MSSLSFWNVCLNLLQLFQAVPTRYWVIYFTDLSYSYQACIPKCYYYYWFVPLVKTQKKTVLLFFLIIFFDLFILKFCTYIANGSHLGGITDITYDLFILFLSCFYSQLLNPFINCIFIILSSTFFKFQN